MAKEVSEFNIDLNGWRVREFRDYLSAVNENDFDRMSELIGKVVLAWPYEGDPSNPEDVLNLSITELLGIARAVGDAMRRSFSQGE